jgi:hypothetical protein
MKKAFLLTVFMLATLAWASAQQPGSMPGRSGGQVSPPGSAMPDPSQAQQPVPGAPDQNPNAPGAAQDQAAAPVTEGCLGGSSPNYTITDQSGMTYKLNIPASADTSKLGPHVGEPVKVMGDVNNSSNPSKASINVQRIGAGTMKCSGSGAAGATAPPKQ